MIIPLVNIFIGMFILMSVLWLYQVVTRNATIVDVGWAYGMGASSVYLALATHGDMGVGLLASILLLIWSLRLGTYLFRARILSGEGEDTRYQTMRKKMGNRANLMFFILFQAQSLFVLLFMAPLLVVFDRLQPLWQWHDILAVIIWTVAVAGETISDKQLHAFKQNPENRGKTCQIGLWQFSRHPNYFFEWLHWFTYPLIAWGAPNAILTWVLPAIMLLFLWKMTGIPFSESQALEHRSDYAAYQRKTSMLIPWFKGK